MTEKLPASFREFSSLYPQMTEAHESLSKVAHEMGPLDDATRILVKLGIAAGAGLESGVKSQVRRAASVGVTREQMHHVALLCTSTAGFPRAVAVFSWIEAQLGAE